MVSVVQAFTAVPNTNVSLVLPTHMDEVKTSAADADVAIVFGSAHSGEGSDRTDLLFHQDPGLLKTEDVM